ncbi:MAG: hypothetical protein BWX93_01933 [Bacteroidetes bacterium ADurb.Bin139]|nr:MAG: hypothetical protein BWX93_01933 [Bacteroidetes bacterium ADurb.Bin139]
MHILVKILAYPLCKLVPEMGPVQPAVHVFQQRANKNPGIIQVQIIPFIVSLKYARGCRVLGKPCFCKFFKSHIQIVYASSYDSPVYDNVTGILFFNMTYQGQGSRSAHGIPANGDVFVKRPSQYFRKILNSCTMHIVCYPSRVFAHKKRVFHAVFSNTVAQQIGNDHDISKECQYTFKNEKGITAGPEFVNIG